MFRDKKKSALHYSIARGLFGFRQPVQMAFLTYLDASGDAVDPRAKVVSVGGFVGHEDVWAEFQPKWEAILTKFGVSELHMKDFTYSAGEFAGWRDDSQKRADFMAAIGGLIRGSGLQQIGATVPLSIYRLYNRHYCVQEAIGLPYTFAALLAIALSADWRERNQIVEPFVFFIEKGDNEQRDLRRHMARIIWDAGYVAEPIFQPKRWVDQQGNVHRVVPFQACDFIAYEHAKAMTDWITHRKTQVRRSFQSAVPPIEDLPDGRSYWSVTVQSSFEKAMVAHGVPRRYNHATPGLRRKLPIDPLCFVDGKPMVAYFYDEGYLIDEG